MPEFGSPLRYPGGKTTLGHFLGEVITLNGIQDCVYAEPFAGGAGAALSLLYSEHVSRILINDADPCVFAFWDSVLNQPGRFLSLLAETPLTIDEWRRQRNIYRTPKRHSRLRLGFATFFLNRCNRSGIIMNAGPIGGIAQKGKWKIGARFNRQELRRRIEKILAYRERIEVSNQDAIDFLRNDISPLARKGPVFVYLDPPYYAKGQLLYLNAYEHDDHVRLAKFIRERGEFKWIVSYDNVVKINKIYHGCRRVSFDLAHTAYMRRNGKEILIHDDSLSIPDGNVTRGR